MADKPATKPTAKPATKPIAKPSTKNPFANMDFVFLSSSPFWLPTKEDDATSRLSLDRLTGIDSVRTWRLVKEGLKKGGATLKCKRAPLTKESLSQAVIADPKILMLSTHGSPDGELLMAMQGARGVFGQLVPAKEMLKTAGWQKKEGRNLELVVLNTCHSISYASVFTALGAQTLCTTDIVDRRLTPFFLHQFFMLLGEETTKEAAEHAGQFLATMPSEVRATWRVTQKFCEHQAELNRLLPADETRKLNLELRKHFVDRTRWVPNIHLPQFMYFCDSWDMYLSYDRELMASKIVSTLVGGRVNTVVLHGETHIGKSTVAKRVANWCYNQRMEFNGGVVCFYGESLRSVPLPVHVARALVYRNNRAPENHRVKKLKDPEKKPFAVIRSVLTRWAHQRGPILMILDNMDPILVKQQELADLLKTLVAILPDAKAPAVRVLMTCRAKPTTMVTGNAGALKAPKLKKIQQFELVYRALCRLRSGENAAKDGPWKWPTRPKSSWEEIKKHASWVVDLIQGRPSMLQKVREFVIKFKITDPRDVEKLWKWHVDVELGVYNKGKGKGKEDNDEDDDEDEKIEDEDELELLIIDEEDSDDAQGRLQAAKVPQPVGRGSPEDGVPYAATGGWHTWSSHDDGDDEDDHARRRHRQESRRHRPREHERHRHRYHHRRERAQAHAARVLRELLAERERLLAENRRLKSAVREIEAELRRALRL